MTFNLTAAQNTPSSKTRAAMDSPLEKGIYAHHMEMYFIKHNNLVRKTKVQ
jgi:hypothetical protein